MCQNGPKAWAPPLHVKIITIIMYMFIVTSTSYCPLSIKQVTMGCDGSTEVNITNSIRAVECVGVRQKWNANWINMA
jgi:hypothetical protein